MKKYTAILLTAALILTLTACSRYISNPAKDFDVTYTFDLEQSMDIQEIGIVGYKGKSVKVRIPEKIARKPVVSVSGFYGKNVESVHIPDGVRSINHHAFGSCTKLTEVTIPLV